MSALVRQPEEPQPEEPEPGEPEPEEPEPGEPEPEEPEPEEEPEEEPIGKRKVSFNKVALKRCPSDENGEYDIIKVPLLPECPVKTTADMVASVRKEDILFTFMWVLNEWDGGVSCVIPSIISRATAKRNMGDRPYGQMIEPTYNELFLLCVPLIAKLKNGESVTLSSKAGRMMVGDVGSVKSLADVLKPIVF